MTIKRAEDGQGLIVRLIETDGQATTATLTMPAVTIEKAWLTNPVEENQSVLDCTEHSVTVPAEGFRHHHGALAGRCPITSPRILRFGVDLERLFS